MDNCVKLLGLDDGETFDTTRTHMSLKVLIREHVTKSGTWYSLLNKEFQGEVS